MVEDVDFCCQLIKLIKGTLGENFDPIGVHEGRCIGIENSSSDTVIKERVWE